MRPPGSPQTTTLDLDNLGRVTQRSESSGAVDRYTKYAYSARGWVTSTVQSDPTASPLEDGPTTSFTYDASGHALSLTDAVGNATTWTYDDVGRVIEEENELEDSRTFDYDDAGRLIAKVDRLGRTTNYVYNERNWLTDENWFDGVTLVRTLSFDYDDAGRLTDATDPAATYAFTFDDVGRLDDETQSLAALSFDIEYASVYNDASVRTQLTAIVDGTADFRNTYTTDDMSRVYAIQQYDLIGGNTVADKRVDFSFNDYGSVVQVDRYADTGTSHRVARTFLDYDDYGRVSSIIHSTDTDAPESGWGDGVLAGYLVEWDDANRVASIDSYADGLSSFSYDNWDQLLSADHASQSDESYSFDDNGNRTGGSYDTDPNNQLATDGTYNYTYDAEGNRLTRTKISNGFVTKYGWDYRNRLVSITEKNNSNVTLSTVAYAYDAFDQRISKSVDPDGPGGSAAVLTVFSWERGHVNLQFDGDSPGDLSHRYLWNPQAIDQILADESVTALNAAGDILWPLPDHQGTIRDLATYDSGLDETEIANHRVFSAFGDLLSETDVNVDHLFAWTGAQRDDESGMQYHRARYYDPAAGRWISEDPIEFAAGGANLVAEVSNNPVSLNDPSGLQQSGIGTGRPNFQLFPSAPIVDPVQLLMQQQQKEIDAVLRDIHAIGERIAGTDPPRRSARFDPFEGLIDTLRNAELNAMELPISGPIRQDAGGFRVQGTIDPLGGSFGLGFDNGPPIPGGPTMPWEEGVNRERTLEDLRKLLEKRLEQEARERVLQKLRERQNRSRTGPMP